MDIEVPVAITSPRGQWCDARAHLSHYNTVDYLPRADEWSTPRSHRCGMACFAPGDTAWADVSSSVAIYVEIEQPKSCVPRRRSPSRPEGKPRPLDVRKGSSYERFTSPPTSPIPSTKHERKAQASPFKLETHPPSRPSYKRTRPLADVDGPDTATLPSKKRRLRLELVTSRLSQPYSLPATHIINREARATGDRRFLKMSAHVEARRGAALGTSVRRFAVLNRTRCVRGSSWTEMGGYLSRDPQGRSRAPAPTSSRTPGPHPTPARLLARSPHSPPRQSLPLPPSRQSPKSIPSPPSPLAWRSEPSDVVPERRSLYEDDDDCEAFPGILYDSCDDPEDVYTDFGAIFDPGARGDEEEGRCFEEYLDELDGISWAAR